MQYSKEEVCSLVSVRVHISPKLLKTQHYSYIYVNIKIYVHTACSKQCKQLSVQLSIYFLLNRFSIFSIIWIMTAKVLDFSVLHLKGNPAWYAKFAGSRPGRSAHFLEQETTLPSTSWSQTMHERVNSASYELLSQSSLSR